jgi:seryl-tRNA(Sec) selenium transferase
MGCLIPLLIVTIIGYFAAHASDAALRYYRFRDAMQQEARFAHRPTRTDDRIRTRLRAMADSLEVPVEGRRINVRRTEQRIRISADYSETIDFLIFSKRFDLRPTVERTF